MITVHIPNNFVPERTYAVRTLLSHYCGVAVDIIIKEGSTDYELRWEDKSIIIKDGFFGKIPEGQLYQDHSRLPKAALATTTPGLDGIVMLYGEEKISATPDHVVCHVDLFAGAFFMLTRWEEALQTKLDFHHRFPSSEAMVVKSGFILRPIVDEYTSLLRSWLLAFGYSLPAKSASYKLVLSCDVDMPYYWSSKPLWKSLGGRWLQHHSLAKSIRDYKSYQTVSRGEAADPFDTFGYLMDLAEKHDTRFQFNFIGGGHTKFEGTYKIHDPKIAALIKVMQTRGHAIGIHPSYDAYKDAVMIANEKHALEQVSGTTITASRQHYLRFSVPETWRHLDSSGLTTDSTMGYAGEPGFRCGTCKPFAVFDIEQRETLNLIEQPLLIMDVSFRMYKKLNIQESIALGQTIKSEVHKHGGDLVVLWHNSSLSEVDGWNGWNQVLESLMA